jgi:prepilin-type N-terminal cleavage/methylation domain-containing protein
MVRAHRISQGFTLVEMLVVIGIIAVLAAIIVPVYTVSRGKAREAQTRAQMTELLLALKDYHRQKGYYPPPPSFNGTRYVGGLSDLYPDYIDSKSRMISPLDPVSDLPIENVPDGYCSYNGKAVSPETGNWALDPAKITYNYWGLSDGTAACGSIPPGYDVGPLNAGTRNPRAGWAGQWDAASPPGTPSRKMPRLANRYAPDNTIAFHCRFTARDVSRDKEQAFLLARLNGQVERVNTYVDPADPGAAERLTNLWVLQK